MDVFVKRAGLDEWRALQHFGDGACVKVLGYAFVQARHWRISVTTILLWAICARSRRGCTRGVCGRDMAHRRRLGARVRWVWHPRTTCRSSGRNVCGAWASISRPKRVAAWAYAQAVLSALWCIEDGTDPAWAMS